MSNVSWRNRYYSLIPPELAHAEHKLILGRVISFIKNTKEKEFSHFSISIRLLNTTTEQQVSRYLSRLFRYGYLTRRRYKNPKSRDNGFYLYSISEEKAL